MQKFALFIKNEKAGSYKKLALFIILLSAVVFLIFFFYADKTSDRSIAITTLCIIAAAFMIDRVLNFKQKGKVEFESILLVVISVGLLAMKYWWPAIIFFSLFLLYRISQRRLLVSVSADEVIYPSFPKTIITWAELNNVILKDDLLTIDFKNNKIIQQLIQKKEPAVNEQEFNDFCKAQLKATDAAS